MPPVRVTSVLSHRLILMLWSERSAHRATYVATSTPSAFLIRPVLLLKRPSGRPVQVAVLAQSTELPFVVLIPFLVAKPLSIIIPLTVFIPFVAVRPLNVFRPFVTLRPLNVRRPFAVVTAYISALLTSPSASYISESHSDSSGAHPATVSASVNLAALRHHALPIRL